MYNIKIKIRHNYNNRNLTTQATYILKEKHIISYKARGLLSDGALPSVCKTQDSVPSTARRSYSEKKNTHTHFLMWLSPILYGGVKVVSG